MSHDIISSPDGEPASALSQEASDRNDIAYRQQTTCKVGGGKASIERNDGQVIVSASDFREAKNGIFGIKSGIFVAEGTFRPTVETSLENGEVVKREVDDGPRTSVFTVNGNDMTCEAIRNGEEIKATIDLFEDGVFTPLKNGVFTPPPMSQ